MSKLCLCRFLLLGALLGQIACVSGLFLARLLSFSLLASLCVSSGPCVCRFLLCVGLLCVEYFCAGLFVHIPSVSGPRCLNTLCPGPCLCKTHGETNKTKFAGIMFRCRCAKTHGKTKKTNLQEPCSGQAWAWFLQICFFWFFWFSHGFLHICSGT